MGEGLKRPHQAGSEVAKAEYWSSRIECWECPAVREEGGLTSKRGRGRAEVRAVLEEQPGWREQLMLWAREQCPLIEGLLQGFYPPVKVTS